MDFGGLQQVLDGLIRVLEGGFMVVQGVGSVVVAISGWLLVSVLGLAWEDWIVGVVDISLLLAGLYLLLVVAKKGLKLSVLVVVVVLILAIISNIL